MNAERVVASLLRDDPAVSSIVGARVFGGIAPEQTIAPLLVYRVSSGDRPPQISPPQVVVTQVDVVCAAKTFDQLISLAQASKDALMNKVGLVDGVGVLALDVASEGTEEYDPVGLEYSQLWTYTVIHTEGEAE